VAIIIRPTLVLILANAMSHLVRNRQIDQRRPDQANLSSNSLLRGAEAENRLLSKQRHSLIQD
jgi:hypothetical protein